MALVLSFVIKRDSEVVDYEDAFGEMHAVDDVNEQNLNNRGNCDQHNYNAIVAHPCSGVAS